MMKNTRAFIALILFLGIGMVFVACEGLRDDPAEVFADMSNETASKKPDSEGEWEVPPCLGLAFSRGDFVPVAANSLGYDLGFEILGGDQFSLEGECRCRKKMISVRFKVPAGDIQRIDYLPVNGNQPVSFAGVYAGSGDLSVILSSFGVPYQASGGNNQNDLSLVLYASPGDRLFVKMSPNFNGGAQAQSVVKSVIGICVVDNIPDPLDWLRRELERINRSGRG